MKTELEKCLSGEWYDCHAPVFIEFKTKTHKLLLEYNALPYDAKEKGAAMARLRAGHARPLQTAVKIYAREGQGREAALPLSR